MLRVWGMGLTPDCPSCAWCLCCAPPPSPQPFLPSLLSPSSCPPCSTGQAEGRQLRLHPEPRVHRPRPRARRRQRARPLRGPRPPTARPTRPTRAGVSRRLCPDVLAQETLFGFEQEYTMFGRNGRIYGWPDNGHPDPQVGHAFLALLQ